MNYEVELKFPLGDATVAQDRLSEAGVAWIGECDQCDKYFAHPSRDFALSDEALRIRQVGDDNFVTYKGPKLDAATKTRRELEFPLGAGPQAAAEFSEFLEALGFRPVAAVRKRRRLGKLAWQQRPFDVAWDNVDQVGTYLELETQATAADLDAARGALLALAQSLKLPSPERRSYLEMLLERST